MQKGVSLINSLNRAKFYFLLKHIIQSETDELFTQTELEKLSQSLKLDDTNIQLLIQSIAYIFKQASKVILKPTTLQDQLVENLKFDAEKAEDFVKLWTEETKKNFDVENSKNLDHLSWELNVETASCFSNKDRFVHSRLQMALASVNGKEKENVVLELDEDEIKHLYTTLEKIQSKIDSV